MKDRAPVRGALLRGVPIQVVVEDGFDRAVGLRADVDGAGGGGLEPLAAERLGETNDAETGAEALFRMRLVLEDQLAQGGGCRPDHGGVLADAVDGPAGVTAVAGRHVLGQRSVLVVAAHAQMRGDPFALDEDLDGTRGEPHFDFHAKRYGTL